MLLQISIKYIKPNNTKDLCWLFFLMILFHQLYWVSSIRYLINFHYRLSSLSQGLSMYVQIYGHLFGKYLRNLYCQLNEVVQWMFGRVNNREGAVSTIKPPSLSLLKESPTLNAVQSSLLRCCPAWLWPTDQCFIEHQHWNGSFRGWLWIFFIHLVEGVPY